MSLKGMKGFLLFDGENVIFRSNGIDYIIIHNDLDIVIDDNDTKIRTNKNGDLVIDHSDATLGY
jgi:hypothetical protein